LLIHNNSFNLDDNLILNEDNSDAEYKGVALRSIDARTHLNRYIDAAELISKNKNLEQKLSKFWEKAKIIRTAKILSKEQSKLLRLHKRYNHVISIADI